MHIPKYYSCFIGVTSHLKVANKGSKCILWLGSLLRSIEHMITNMECKNIIQTYFQNIIDFVKKMLGSKF